MVTSVILAIASFLLLVWHSRSIKATLGMPLAYLFAVLLYHLPGGIAHILNPDYFGNSTWTELGMDLTGKGILWFVVGAIIAQRMLTRNIDRRHFDLVGDIDPKFLRFTLIFGLFLVYLICPFIRIPSLSAALDQGACIWIIGMLLGLIRAINSGKKLETLAWLVAISVYPVVGLIFGGFLSFGSTSVFIIFAAVLVTRKKAVIAYLGLFTFSAVIFLMFLSYFQARDEIRRAVWGGASFSDRIEQSVRIITDFGLFDSQNPAHLYALDERLNQNKFIGMAVENLQAERTKFLEGRSISEAFLAIIPRAIWPNKPVFAGSSNLIRETTLRQVNDTTTFGVGVIMELYINFGMASLILGSIVFGFVYAYVDTKAAILLHRKDYAKVFPWFLAGIALFAPLGLMAKMASDLASALIAGLGWRFVWNQTQRTKVNRNPLPRSNPIQASNSASQAQAPKASS